LEGLVFDSSVDLKPFVDYEFENSIDSNENNNDKKRLKVTLRDKSILEHKTGTVSFIDYYR